MSQAEKATPRAYYVGRMAVLVVISVVIFLLLNTLFEFLINFIWLFLAFPFFIFTADTYFSFKYHQEHSRSVKRLGIFISIFLVTLVMASPIFEYSIPVTNAQDADAVTAVIFFVFVLVGPSSLAGIFCGGWLVKFLNLEGIEPDDFEKHIISFDTNTHSEYIARLFTNVMANIHDYYEGKQIKDDVYLLIKNQDRILLQIINHKLLIFPFRRNGRLCYTDGEEIKNIIDVTAKTILDFKPAAVSDEEINEFFVSFKVYQKPQIDISSITYRFKDENFRKAIQTPLIFGILLVGFILVFIYRNDIIDLIPSNSLDSVILVAIGTAVGMFIFGIGKEIIKVMRKD